MRGGERVEEEKKRERGRKTRALDRGDPNKERPKREHNLVIIIVRGIVVLSLLPLEFPFHFLHLHGIILTCVCVCVCVERERERERERG